MTVDRDTPQPSPRPSPQPSPRPFAGPQAIYRPRRRFGRVQMLGVAGSVLAIMAVAGVLLIGPRLGAARGAPQTVQATGLVQPAPAGMQQMLDTTLAPDEIRPITPDEARVLNAAIPFSGLPILPAKPFIMPADRLEDYARALDCLTAAVYYEAAGETAAGQAAVAQVVINRMRHPAYPKTVCGVIFQGSERKTGCQFSFSCDGAMARKPSVDGWARARLTATGALNGFVASSVGMATHYHTDWVAPYWAERLVKMRQIGTHIFYRWGGAWGLPPAFTGRHADVEPVVEKMALVATPLEPLELDDPALLLPPAPPPVLVTVAPLSPLPSTPVVQPPADQRSAATAASSPTAASPAPVARPTVENPLVTGPAEAQPRRRSRIAAPS